MPDWLRGLSGTWFYLSSAAMIFVVLIEYFAFREEGFWAGFFTFAAVLILGLSNFWLRDKLISPLIVLATLPDTFPPEATAISTKSGA